ncbi:AT-hook motif nuclear-localized protein 8 isoform X1 [Rhodamnia argentea]|uniref:AT-hook motif nuclear-localized protein n=1 Tax=Rhodamnia argentea TaxID=178133 RepID=A0A8B8PHP3_9MYRT|nr:AT-hook motif nuclear-localized protein 8 isoform X1 [Rhodamnia argentea]
MDSRDAAPPPGMVGVVGSTGSYPNAGPPQPPPPQQPPHLINPNSSAVMMQHRFPFNSMVGAAPPPPPQQHQHQHQQHQHQHQQQQQQPEGMDSLNNAGGIYDGSSQAGLRPGGFSIEPAKKKRGRPRKYTPEGNIALGLGPTSVHSSSGGDHHHHHGGGTSGGGGDGNLTGSSEHQAKKHRGRPPGLGKKQMDALGVGGVGFTPHVIHVDAGEDVASKIMAFSLQGPRTICILSASGAICNVTLRQPALNGGTVTYEGRFEIICLSGSFLCPENETGRSRAGALSISLAGPDGRVLGGGVAGLLIAATPVQVIVGSFLSSTKKASSSALKSDSSPTPQGPQSHMLNFGATGTAVSPPSDGASGESSDENGNSPINHRPSGHYNNTSQPIHNMQMYHHLWAGQTPH